MGGYPAAPRPRTQSPPSGPGQHPAGASLGLGPLPASWPIRARFRPLFLKVSQNRGVSPEYHHKACHAPCFQNGLQMSALEKLRFPFWLAFSHKELMGSFWPKVGVHCQNDEVSTECTPWDARGGRRYPHGHRSKLLLVSAPHLLSARDRLAS